MTTRKEETVFCEMCHISQKKIHAITTNCKHEFCPECMVRLMCSHVDFCENTVSCPVCNNAITSYECEEEKEEEKKEKDLALSQLLFKNLQWKKRKDKRRTMIEKRKANMERRRKDNKKIEKIESERRRKVCVADNIMRRRNDDVEKNKNDAWNAMIMRWREKKMMTTWREKWREKMRKDTMSSLKKKKIGSMK